MKLRLLVFALAWTLCLSAQRRFSWQNACFNNPGAPFCPGHDFAVKRTKDGKTPAGAYEGVSSATPATDAAGIDWRFADPAADSVAVLSCTKLSASPLAHSLIEQLGAGQSLSAADTQKIFRAFSGAEQVALSIREDRLVLVLTGRPPDAILPGLEPGWKAVPLPGNSLLMGNTDSVEQAVQRLATPGDPGELGVLALERPADLEFWAAGAAKFAGQDAVTAGVKRFSLTASIRDRLVSETVFEFDAVPDARQLKAWLKSLADDAIDGSVVHVKTSMTADEVRKNSDQIAASLLGQRLGVLIKSARFLPVRDTATTTHAKPVIYGLDGGPKEVSQFVPSTPAPVSQPPAPATAASLSGTWAFTHGEGRFLGTVEIHQNGSTFSGTWHTSAGKSEPDDPISGRIDGNTITMVRFVGSNQTFVLTLSADGSRLDGFGNGYFLNHTNLNMQRVAATPTARQ
jgi:hypothetical protein